MAVYPGPTSTFVPSHEASGSLITGFIRNPSKFKLLQYMKYVPVSKTSGYYLRLTAEEAARVINTNLADFVWMDGQEAPIGNDNLESFDYKKFATQRYAHPFNLGQKTIEQADWPVLALHAAIAAQKAMTVRTVAAWTELDTAASWEGSTDTATNLGGGQWHSSTTALSYIKKTFMTVVERILLATLGTINREDIVCVMNPKTARLTAGSQEIIDHLKQSVYALPELRGDKPGQNTLYGLPDTLYGVRLVVEDAVRVTSKKGATKATTFVCPDHTAVFMSKTGGVTGIEGMADFSTVQQFNYEEFTVETKDDPDNRRTVGRVVHEFSTEIVAPASGYRVTAATA